ncbi:MAG TPA: DUF4446 family protein [Paenibacillus sp.]|uniref:DUF4446 family protein n=1 Tax=Paenibacillus sp. TaxID=58172 RepID=UPI0028D24556|nr:DUF4446 family protein [Paenibacillus sp.]HUC93604.1 DUF4446 family protein [Paenibacillus sp.]
MENLTTGQLGLYIVVLTLIILAMMIGMMRTSSKLKRLSRQYRAMMDGSGVADLEQVIADLQRRLQAKESEAAAQVAEMAQLREGLRRTKGKVGIRRFNAFEGQGSDLSFAVAIMNEEQDGIVLSGIHTREETYMYAKPVENGESSYPLTPEERNAITLALQQK